MRPCLKRLRTAGHDYNSSLHAHQAGKPSSGQSQAVALWPVGAKGQSSGIGSECVAHATSFIYYKKSVRLRRQPYLTALRRPAAGATPLRCAKVRLGTSSITGEK